MKLSTILQLKKRNFSLNESFANNPLFKKYNDQLNNSLSFFKYYKRTEEYVNETRNYDLVRNYAQLKVSIFTAVQEARHSKNPKEELQKLDTFKGRYDMLHYGFEPNEDFHNFATLLRYCIPLFQDISLDTLDMSNFEEITMKEFKHVDVREKLVCFFENSNGDLLGITFGNNVKLAFVPRDNSFFYPTGKYDGIKLSELNLEDKDKLQEYIDGAFKYVTPYEIIYTNIDDKLGTTNANFFTKEPGTAKKTNHSLVHGQEEKQKYLLSDISKIYALRIGDLQTTKRDSKIENRREENYYKQITTPSTYMDPHIQQMKEQWKLQENRYKLLSAYTRILKEFDPIKERLDFIQNSCAEIRKTVLQSQTELMQLSIKTKKTISTTETNAFTAFFTFVETLVKDSFLILVDIGKIGDIDVKYNSPLIADAKKIDDQDRKLHTLLYSMQCHVQEINGLYQNQRFSINNAVETFANINKKFEKEIFDIQAITKFILTNYYIDIRHMHFWSNYSTI